eukprot:SAG25_NODE_1138_length_3816_cov_4.312887_9_plen_120_part_00
MIFLLHNSSNLCTRRSQTNSSDTSAATSLTGCTVQLAGTIVLAAGTVASGTYSVSQPDLVAAAMRDSSRGLPQQDSCARDVRTAEDRPLNKTPYHGGGAKQARQVARPPAELAGEPDLS